VLFVISSVGSQSFPFISALAAHRTYPRRWVGLGAGIAQQQFALRLHSPSFSASDFLFRFSRLFEFALFFVSANCCRYCVVPSVSQVAYGWALSGTHISVFVAQTARDLKKSPRKLLFMPSAAALIQLLRSVSPMMDDTFLAKRTKVFKLA
jgi:hypothetical protein